jgi:putative nucleotidyltransferase with HDIG domain
VSRSVRRLILISVAAAVLAIAAAYFLFPIHQELGGAVGLVFWIGATLLASALPVPLPRGTVVSVAAGPMIAVMILGGPFAAGIVGLIGTTDSREVRGQVPWYGTVYNHASAVIAVVLGGFALELVNDLLTPSVQAEVASFISAVVGAAAFFFASWYLALTAVSVRTGTPMRTIWAQDVTGVAANFVGLAPLAWLMAQVFMLPNGVGWWATPLFVVPLFTTRLAYARYVETRELFEQTITALSKAVDARDTYTRDHSFRVSYITEAMCRVMRLPEHEIERIKWAGLLHDVGKIGVRDHILLKEGPLNKEERIRMNQHPTIGAEIVEQASQLSGLAPLVATHHEWFNGSGYPGGREALDIPLGARILTIADAYEAMTSSRPYRKTPLTHEQAIDQLEKFSGIQFDPEIVPILVNLDRSILDRPPDRPEVMPSMFDSEGQPSPNADTRSQDASSRGAAAATAEADRSQARPALASDDVS